MAPVSTSNKWMDLHHYASKLERAKERIKAFRDGELALSFLNHLRTGGLTDARLWFYASRLTNTLKWFEEHGVRLKDASRKDVEAFVSYILSKPYKAWTKQTYAILIKKLVAYAKTGTLAAIPKRPLGSGPHRSSGTGIRKAG